MAITLYPTRRVEYLKSSGIITKVSTNNSEAVTKSEDYEVVFEFDTSALTVYGSTTGGQNQQVKVAFSKIPTSDSYRIEWYFYKNVNFDFEVGNIASIGADYYNFGSNDTHSSSYPVSWYSPYILTNESNKFYVRLTFKAINWDGTIGSQAPDQTFIFSGTNIVADVGADRPFEISSSFLGGYHNPNTELVVQVSVAYTYGIKQYSLANAVLHYKKKTSQTYTDVAVAGNAITLPVGTFDDNEEYDLYISGTSTSGATAITATMTLSTIDGIGSTNAISPRNEITYGNVVFDWDYSVSTGADQYAYDIQISSDNGSTWETVLNHIVSHETIATYQQSAVGATLWRIRGYNQNDVAGAWSDSLYYVNNVPPEAPNITSISGQGRKKVSWSADQQIAYEMKVIGSNAQEAFTTGEVYSTSKTALVNEYLENGTYTFMVRIAAGFGKWSEWASVSVNVSASLPDPQVSAAVSEGVTISITQDATFSHFYILKNGVPIAKTADAYTDSFVNGTVTYRIVGVGEDDAYGYAYITVTYKPKFDYFVARSGTVIRCDLRWDRRVFTVKTISPKYQAYEMLGERYPTHFINSRARSQAYTIAAYDENNTFDNLIGDAVYFCSKDNGGAWCVVTGISRSEELFGNDTSLSIEATNYSEAIEYDL